MNIEPDKIMNSEISESLTFANNRGKATANISVTRVRSSSCVFFSFAVRTFSMHKTPAAQSTWNHSRSKVNPFYLKHDGLTLTLFPVPLPTGGWHSQACRMAQSMISTRAVSWRSFRAKKKNIKNVTKYLMKRLALLREEPIRVKVHK